VQVNAQTKIEVQPVKSTGLELLRMPFPANHISKLPKETKAQADARKADKSLIVWKCAECGGMHHKNAVHLDYVGHAALTDRLLDVDPEWNWEPYVAPGLPNPGNGMWIKLTVCGMSRIGFGSADGKSGGDAIKEIIGDALRNAAMRFGAALDLWHKGDLHADDEAEQVQHDADRPKANADKAPAREMPDAEWARLIALVEATGVKLGGLLKKYQVENLRHLNQDQYANAIEGLSGILAQKAKEESDAKARSAATTNFSEILEDEVPF